MTGSNGGHQWLMVGGRLQWVAVVGGACEKFSKLFFDPNELKSPKNNMSFYHFFLFRVGGSNP